jgi:hypothetical protein
MNILATLARCSLCGGTMTRVFKGSMAKAGVPKLVCTTAKAGNGCTYHGVSIPEVERALVSQCDVIAKSAPLSGPPGLQARLDDAKLRLGERQAVLNRVSALILEIDVPQSVVEQVRKAESARDEVAAEMAGLQRQVAQSNSQFVARRVDNLWSALRGFGAGLWGDSVNDANAALRECMERVVVDHTARSMSLVWRHGPPPTVIGY